MNTEKNSKPSGRILFRLGICSVILLVGVAAMLILKGMKKAPLEAAVAERVLRVSTLLAQPENIAVQMSGFGEVQVVNKVPVSAEVPGKVVFSHPRLEQGEIIEENATLITIDPSDYLAVRESARAEVARLKNHIRLISRQLELDNERLKLLVRSSDLAAIDYERQRKLYRKDGVGSLSDVEKLERSANAANDQAAQLAKAVVLYPLQKEEAESSLAAAQSRLLSAEKNLSRCDIKAPFTGRLAQVSVEKGQYVSPGQVLYVLADDSLLEIPVALDSREARKWLRFKPGTTSGWLQDVEPVACEIRWTEDDTRVWKGLLHRVMNFDPVTRTLTVAVRVQQQQEYVPGRLPLVEGMFCSVRIPGRIMDNVYRLPRWSVSFNNTVFLAENNRLKTVQVTVEKTHGEDTFVSKGLSTGAQVITTRLVEPLENSLLEILKATPNQSNSEEKP